MKKQFIFLAAAAALPFAGAAELKLSLDGESMKAPAGVKRISSTIRLVPGKIGKAMLIERRTVNFFKADDVVLGDGVKLSGKNNTLVMPADSMAALPLTAIRPQRPCTLSFRYRGEGKITVTFNGEAVAAFQAEKEFKSGSAVIIPAEDSGTLRIRTEKAVELTEVMFDKDIGYANTYHAPGPMRNVDVINVNPGVYNPKEGAVSCWIKAPWLNKNAQHATAIGLLRFRNGQGNTSEGIYICAWTNSVNFIYYGAGKKGLSCSLKMSELPESKDGWYHFVFNWKEEKPDMVLSTIVNGEKVFTAKKLCPASKPATEISVGYVNGAYLNGMLDDFGIFSAPLSKEDALKIYKSAKPLAELYAK